MKTLTKTNKKEIRLKKILFFILLFTCVCTLSIAQTEKDIFDEGVRYFKQGQYPQAVESFTKLIELSPGNADAYKNRGVTYMKQEKFDLAISDFEKAKKLFPELKGLYSNLGVAWYYKKEYEKAIESYDMEIMLEPDHHVAYFNRALCLAELGRNKEALYDLAKTLGLKPDFYWAICYKGDILTQTGEHAMAIKTYKQAIQVDPEISYAREKLSELKEKSKGQERMAAKKPPAPKSKSQELKSISLSDSSSQIETADGSSHEIQVGAFLGRENAVRMRERLIANGFDSRVLVLEDKKDRSWYLVRSGRYPDKDTAKKAIPQINQAMGVKSVARPFGDW